MPLFKNKGRYGSLGNWGKEDRKVHIGKKKVVLIVALLVLAGIFSISKNQQVLPVVFGDYNSSFSHTRTPIFVDTQFIGPTISGGPISFNLMVNATQASGTSLALPSLVISTTGDRIIVGIYGTGAFNGFTITDSQTNAFTEQVFSLTVSGSGISTYIYTTTTATSGSDSITIATGGPIRTFQATAADYSGIVGYGNSATMQNDNDQGSFTSSVTLTVSASSKVVEEISAGDSVSQTQITASSSQTLRMSDNPGFRTGARISFFDSPILSAGSQTLSFSVTGVNTGINCPYCGVSHSALEIQGGQPVTTDFSRTRWNFNTTCVSLTQTNNLPSGRFDFSKGIAGSGGANCSSADIMISKASANLQTGAGRMLEMVDGWINFAGSTVHNVTVVLRTNATLPSFTENYNPVNDVQARLIWVTTRANQTVYVARDNTKTLGQESLSNDLVVQGNSTLNNSSTFFDQQVILNFTGPTNFMYNYGVTFTSSTSNNTASSLQFGQDYYVLVMAQFSGSPSGGSYTAFLSTRGISPVTVNPFGIWSVPASCSDPVNKVACSIPTAQPVFQYNPIDPSSWGNAIIKGLLWVFSVAVPSGLSIMAQVLVGEVRVVGNIIGEFFGWGALGDNIITFFSGVAGIFPSIVTAFGWFAGLVSNAGSMITLMGDFANKYFPGLTNFLNDAVNAVASGIVLNLIGEIAFWFPTTYMIILITFYFLMVLMNGLKGFFEWLHLVKWSAFGLFNIFARLAMILVDFITAILGRISVVSPGHKFPRVPHLNPGGLPRMTLGFGDMALFHDPTTWFLGILGFFFTWMWVGTTSAGLPGSTQNIIQSMQSLTLTMFGISFMVLILVIPGWLLGKMGERGLLE